MAEPLYEAQSFFPEKCIDCPSLVGLIEDGIISPGDATSQEVNDALEEYAAVGGENFDFDACDGPLVGTVEIDAFVIMCNNPVWNEITSTEEPVKPRWPYVRDSEVFIANTVTPSRQNIASTLSDELTALD